MLLLSSYSFFILLKKLLYLSSTISLDIPKKSRKFSSLFWYFCLINVDFKAYRYSDHVSWSPPILITWFSIPLLLTSYYWQNPFKSTYINTVPDECYSKMNQAHYMKFSNTLTRILINYFNLYHLYYKK